MFDATPYGKMITEAELNAEEATRNLQDIMADLLPLCRELTAKLKEINNGAA
jgi:polyhydroxyalkanoate synthesis regulator phasin